MLPRKQPVKYLGTFDSPTNVHASVTWTRDFGSAHWVLASDFRFNCLALVSSVTDLKLKGSSDVFSSLEHGRHITPQVNWDWWRRRSWWSIIRSSIRWAVSYNTDISYAAFIGSPPDLDEPIQAPSITPRVLDQPVISTIFISVSNHQNGMVHSLSPGLWSC